MHIFYRNIHSPKKVSGHFADFLYKVAFLKSKFEDDPVSTKTEVFFERPTLTAGVGVHRRNVSHFKGLFKTFKMRYSTFLYSDGIIFEFRFQKSRFIEEISKVPGYFFAGLTISFKPYL